MKCTTTGCPKAVEVLSIQKCATCASYLRRWLKLNSPARMRQRRATIAVWDARLGEMLAPKSVAKRRKAR